jgi:rubredoxin
MRCFPPRTKIAKECDNSPRRLGAPGCNGAALKLRTFWNELGQDAVSDVIDYKSWVCVICGWVYNEEEGLPDEGIAAGTRFADIPDDWRCPLCDVGKGEFAVVEF